MESQTFYPVSLLRHVWRCTATKLTLIYTIGGIVEDTSLAKPTGPLSISGREHAIIDVRRGHPESVPTRHIHSHNAIFRRNDFDMAVELVIALVQALDKKAANSLTSR